MNFISPWIYTTRNCNLSCSYCYEKICKKNISKKTFYSINEYFEKQNFDFINYRISGGEPLLNFNTWKNPVLSAIKNNNGKLSAGIITNLTLLNKNIEKFIIDNKISLSISLDGLKYSKPYKNNNKSSSSVVVQNINKLLKNGFRNFNISTVLDKNTFKGLEKLAEYISINNFQWSITLDHFFAGEIDFEILIKKLNNIIDILFKNGYDLYSKLRFNNIVFNNPEWGCSAGKYLIAIDTDGNIFPCHTVIEEKKLTDVYSDENLIDVLKKQKVYNVGYNYKYDKVCNSCLIKKLCGSGCKLHNLSENKKYTCKIIKTVTLNILEKIMEGNYAKL